MKKKILYDIKYSPYRFSADAVDAEEKGTEQ